jgi:hypothetical protein
MTDNTRGGSESGTAPLIATDEVTHSGDTADVQLIRPVHVTGSEGSKTVVDITDAYGRLQVTQYDADLALTPGMTGLRDITFAQRWTNLGDSLADGLDANMWTTTSASGGTATSTGGEAVLATTTSTTGSVVLAGRQLQNYMPGQVHWFNSAIRLGDTGTAGNIRRFGAFTISGTTPQEGAYFELSGTTLNAVTVKAGTPTATASGSWSKFSTAPFTLDTNYHFFEIRYTGNTVWFIIDNVLRHVTTTTSVPITTTLNWPITLQNTKTSGASDITLAARNVGLGRFGAPKQPPHDIGYGYNLQTKTAQYTTTQTGTAFWTPTSGKRLVVTQYQIQVGGTTAGNFQLWYGASGDTTYTRATDRAIYEGDVVPSASYKPAVVSPTGAWPAGAPDDVLRVTTSAGITITFTVWGYEY